MMTVAGIGWISGEVCGSVRRAWQGKFEDPKFLYTQLEQEGFFSIPPAKVRWLNTVSNRYCLAAALALRDAFGTSAALSLNSAETGVLGLSRDGALQANKDYFKDYVSSGRKLARGNLFVHTLPTSPLSETAITFGFKGPIFHLSALNPKLELLIERGDALGKNRALNLMCFAADDQTVIAFFLKSRDGTGEPPLFSLNEMKQSMGSLAGLKEILSTLKIETTTAS